MITYINDSTTVAVWQIGRFPTFLAQHPGFSLQPRSFQLHYWSPSTAWSSVTIGLAVMSLAGFFARRTHDRGTVAFVGELWGAFFGM